MDLQPERTMKRLLVIIGLMLALAGASGRATASQSSNSPPHSIFPPLTREQMFQDYDRLAAIIKQVFPLMEVNKRIYGLDVGQLLAANRSQIEGITQTTQFVDLINQTIVGCRGSHFWIAAPPRGTYYQGFVEDEAYALAGNYQQYLTLGTRGNSIELPLLYFNGSYYTLCDFTCTGRTYPKGMKVRTCNGKTPDALVEALRGSGILLDWDYDLSKFYTTAFYKYQPLASSNSVIAFELEGTNGRPVGLELGAGRQPEWHMRSNAHSQPQVALVNTNILYIRLPAMDPQQIPFFVKELRKYQGKAIRKAVIDIRNNGGGSDQVWGGLLALLLKQKMTYSIALAVKISEINSQYLPRHPFGKQLHKHGKLERIGFLNNEEFKVLRISQPIKPEADSLKLECSIFVLSENVYSSAGSLMNICKQSEQLVSVGLPNSRILGLGIDPFAFSLPNSKLVFWIEPVVDLTDARTAKDTHHNDVEERVRPTLEQLLDYYGTGDEVPLEERLNKHDPFFKRVLEK